MILTGLYIIWKYIFLDVQDEEQELPEQFSLHQNYTNPFTTIKYTLPKASNVSIKIYNLKSQLITTLVNKYHQLGNYTVDWNAAGESSGVYFYRIRAGEYTAVRKCVVLK